MWWMLIGKVNYHYGSQVDTSRLIYKINETFSKVQENRG